MTENMEQRYQNILVGLDGSPQANYAFECAIEVARRNNGRVICVAILQHQMFDLLGYGNINEETLQREADAFQGLLKDVVSWAKEKEFENIDTEVVVGSPKEQLATILPEKYNVDLIMVGQSGMSGVERFMVGSVSTYVIRHAKCDVLVIALEKIE